MPEAPDLEVIKEVLARRLQGRRVASTRVLRATVLRSLAAQDFASDVPGRTLDSIARRGKFLLLSFSGERVLVINPMLTGALQLCEPKERLLKSACFVLGVEDAGELRYLDNMQMGRVYYTTPESVGQIPGLSEQGPDALSDNISLSDFKARLSRYHGEIKGILTRGAVVSGIGNAYADEVLFAAGISPFRNRRTLSDQDLERLHASIGQVLSGAVVVLRERMGEETHHKIRDFLQVHRKGGQPCPRCGAAISQLTANQRITSYCRHCQPGMRIKN
ncbi:MAG: Fpg/Nei family DNA glycosylase [Chloroflexi bacterium]|nr:Fpg/Nei family DNA glycosylase [Chloroflexota bacterium]